MRKNRRIAALLTAGLLALTPCVSAGMMFASAEECTITVDNSDSGYTYTAYKIFKGDKSGTGPNYVLSNIDWADGFKGADFLTALKGDSVLGTTFASANNPEAVATALDTIKTDNNKLAQFAKLAFANKGTTTSVASTYDATTGYSIPATEAGYYLVEETSVPSGAVTSRYMLKVAGPTEVSPKRPLPSIDKKIDEKGGIAANTASVGDVVPYIIKTKVPDMTGYTKYFFILNDTLSEGLTYKNDLSITVNGTSLVKDTDYTVETSGTDTTAIKVVFMNFYEKYKGLNDDNPNNDDIIVKYSAEVNGNADMTQTGNINTAQLTYSNNPNINPRGENEPAPSEDEDNPDTPEDETKPDPTGQTPQIKTVTYVTQIDLTKTKADGTTPLKDATFKLEGYKKTVGASAGKYYVKDDAGTYYRLKDGSYKLVSEFVAGTDEYYDSTTTKYKEVNLDSEEAKAEKFTLTGTSNEDGKINFAGLGEGTYTITETDAPSGFNMLKKPITVTITASGVSITGCTWGKTLTDPNNATTAGEFVQGDKEGTDSSLPLTVKNTEGSTLPSTGGVGTKLFYLFGGMLAVGSGVVLVTKKRMSYEK